MAPSPSACLYRPDNSTNVASVKEVPEDAAGVKFCWSVSCPYSLLRRLVIRLDDDQQIWAYQAKNCRGLAGEARAGLRRIPMSRRGGRKGWAVFRFERCCANALHPNIVMRRSGVGDPERLEKSLRDSAK